MKLTYRLVSSLFSVFTFLRTHWGRGFNFDMSVFEHVIFLLCNRCKLLVWTPSSLLFRCDVCLESDGTVLRRRLLTVFEELALAWTPKRHQFHGTQYPYADTNDLNPWRMKWSCNLFLAQNDYGVMNHQRFHYRYFSVELELFFFVRRLGILTHL